MTIEIRPVARADLPSWAESVSDANSEELSDEVWRDVEPTLELERTLGAYDGDRIVGGGSIFSFDLTVPGGEALPSAGVTWIGVSPTHRRRGALRGLMGAMFDNARDRNEPLAVLWASEGSIYQRFGYGLSTLALWADLERDRAQLISAAAPQGSVRLVDRDEARRIIPLIYEHNRATIPGFYTRSPMWWDVEVLSDFKWARRGYDRKFFAVHEHDGVPDAYAIYHVRHDWSDGVPGSELQVMELMALGGDAAREMWRFIFGIDLIKRITTRPGAAGDALMLMVTEPRRVNLRVRDGMWLCVLDVPMALERRGYTADGTVVLEIVDDFRPAAGGRFRLTTRAGRGTVERTDAAPDVVMDAADLGAIYLGGYSLGDLARAGRTQERTSGARARADAMLATSIDPWCPQIF
jgi:predicted acetyltransferase